MTTDSSLVGIVDLQRCRRLLHSPVHPNQRRRLCVLPIQKEVMACQSAAGGPASRIDDGQGHRAVEIPAQDSLGHAHMGAQREMGKQNRGAIDSDLSLRAGSVVLSDHFRRVAILFPAQAGIEERRQCSSTLLRRVVRHTSCSVERVKANGPLKASNECKKNNGS
jgi:hypothetical protein